MAGTIGRVGCLFLLRDQDDHDRRGRDARDRRRRDRRRAPASCRFTASAAMPGSATRRAAPGTTRSRTPGFKYNMTDIAAALGLVQLDARRRAARSAAVSPALHAQPARHRRRRSFELPPTSRTARTPGTCSSCGFARPVLIDRARSSRRSATGYRHERPLHPTPSPPVLPTTLGSPSRLRWPTAEFERVISLPIWPGMTRDDVERVVNGLTGSSRAHGARESHDPEGADSDDSTTPAGPVAGRPERDRSNSAS